MTPEAAAAAAIDPAALEPQEKKHYLMMLITLAASDENVAVEELAIIREAAKRLRFQLRRSDLKRYNLERIVAGIQRPSLRKELFEQLLRMAKADRTWSREELRIIKHIAERWGQPLPSLGSLDWSTVKAPGADEVEQIGETKRQQVQQQRKAVSAADPGIQWRWVFAGLGIYVLLSIIVSLLLQNRRVGTFDGLGILFGLVVCFLTGLIVGLKSPGRTLREPAMGVGIPMVLLFIYVLFAGGLAVGAQVLFAFSLAFAIQYGMALFGAWCGEYMQDNA